VVKESPEWAIGKVSPYSRIILLVNSLANSSTP
jgi:hypothetical protein